MTHPLIEQYRFVRREFLRGLEGLTEEDAAQHFGQMNCISWIVGHMAWHEQKYWLELAQNKILFPDLNALYAYGVPMSTPQLNEMLEKWHTVTESTEPFLDGLTTVKLKAELLRGGRVVGQSYGTAVHRVTYHYWYHIGESQAIRQLLGHKPLPEFVGNLESEAPFKP